jgi:hypothetical protein
MNQQLFSNTIKGHYVPTYNMVDYTPQIIILPNVKSIGPRRSCVHKISKMLENIKASELLQKSLNQNGGIIWPTTHHGQLPYQIWKLSDKWSRRSRIRKVQLCCKCTKTHTMIHWKVTFSKKRCGTYEQMN